MKVIAGETKNWGQYKVFLNGKDISDSCFYADEENNRIKVYRRNKNGQFYMDKYRKRVMSKTLYGKVELLRRLSEDEC